jgi:hypothetical protein
VSWYDDRFFLRSVLGFCGNFWPIFSNFKKFEFGQMGNFTLERGLVGFWVIIRIKLMGKVA